MKKRYIYAIIYALVGVALGIGVVYLVGGGVYALYVFFLADMVQGWGLDLSLQTVELVTLSLSGIIALIILITSIRRGYKKGLEREIQGLPIHKKDVLLPAGVLVILALFLLWPSGTNTRTQAVDTPVSGAEQQDKRPAWQRQLEACEEWCTAEGYVGTSGVSLEADNITAHCHCKDSAGVSHDLGVIE